MAGEVSKYAMESAYKDVERDALARTTAQENPKAILLGGQPGSGKSALAAEAIRELRANGGAVVIDADRMREENPRYKQLSREDPQHAADRTQKEAGEWATRLTLAAVENRRNLVVDGTMLCLTQDYTFSSPSMASSVVLGRTSNGRIEWKTTDGETLKELQEKEAKGK